MQAITYPQEKISLYTPNKRDTQSISRKQDERILHFSMLDALPGRDLLALDLTLGTLSYMSLQNDLPKMLAQQQFTNNEMSVLLPLLENHPYYSPYEVLYASFYSNAVNDKTLELSRRQLQEATESGLWDQQMRPIRNVLSRTRLKTRALGIDILSILETGYILRFTPSLREN